MESLNITRKILNEHQIDILISKTKSEQLRESIRLSYFDGLKISDILSRVKIPRRTLQGKLSRLGEKVFGIKINFEQIRQSCMVRLINQGYTPEYITEFMGYSRKDTYQYRRRLAGYLSPKMRYDVLRKDNFKCRSCRNKRRLHVDHIVPVSEGGKTEMKNLQTLCERCNLGKGDNF